MGDVTAVVLVGEVGFTLPPPISFAMQPPGESLLVYLSTFFFAKQGETERSGTIELPMRQQLLPFPHITVYRSPLFPSFRVNGSGRYALLL